MRIGAQSFNSRRATGFSLIELLVAMGLSLLLLAGVVTMFVSSKSTYEVNDRLARVEENGRFALDSIVRSIRASGYLGCASQLPNAGARPHSILNQPTGLDLATSFVTYPTSDSYNETAIQGFEYMGTNLWTPTLDTGFVISPASGSDVLSIRQPKPNMATVELTSSMTTQIEDLHVTKFAGGSGPIKTHDIVLISSCTDRTYFEITDYDAKNGIVKHEQLAPAGDGSYLGNQTNDLKHLYLAYNPSIDDGEGHAVIIPLQNIIYYVRQGTAGNGTSLWRKNDAGTAEELVEGVDAMRIRFGIDNNNDRYADQYIKPSSLTASDNVISVSVALLIRSLDEYGTVDADNNDYDLFNDGEVDFHAPGDHRLRQIYTTTATIRNRSE